MPSSDPSTGVLYYPGKDQQRLVKAWQWSKGVSSPDWVCFPRAGAWVASMRSVSFKFQAPLTVK